MLMESIDLLVFGPHPDDIEIGLGGTIARHAAEGHARRPVRSHARRAVDATARRTSARPKPRPRRACSAPRGARISAGPTAASPRTPTAIRSAVELIRQRAPANDRGAVLGRSPSRSCRRQPGAPHGGVPQRPAAIRHRAASAWRPEWICYYFINDSATPSFVVDVSAHYEPQARGARLLSQSVRARRRRRGRHATDRADVPAADREPRCPVRRAGRRRVRRRHRRPRADRSARVSSSSLHEDRHGVLRVGRRQRRASRPSWRTRSPTAVISVHLISSEPPFRWRSGVPGLFFERVTVPPYPLFREPQYLLALANTIARVAESEQLDIVHAHYAVPHATAAYLADQMLASVTGASAADGDDAARHRHHAGRQRPVVRARRGLLDRAVARRHGGVREPQGRHDRRARHPTRDSRHPELPRLRRLPPSSRPGAPRTSLPAGRRRCARRARLELPAGEARRRCGRRLPPHPPTRSAPVSCSSATDPSVPQIERLVSEHGLEQAWSFVGEQHDLVPWLSVADVFLLPSAQESFGLAALEAMACEVPVVASNVGGLPEIIDDGVTGFVCPPDALDEMAERGIEILTDAGRRESIGRHAAEVVRTRYCSERIVPLLRSGLSRRARRASRGRAVAQCWSRQALEDVRPAGRVWRRARGRCPPQKLNVVAGLQPRRRGGPQGPPLRTGGVSDCDVSRRAPCAASEAERSRRVFSLSFEA